MCESKKFAALQALVADVGKGNVIDAELLEGCLVEPHELDEMDAQQAAIVAAHCFAILFDHKIEQPVGGDADPVEGLWRGSIDSFKFVIQRDGSGDLVLDFIDAP